MKRRIAAAGVVLMALAAIGAKPSAVRYPSPVEVLVSPDGARLFVICEGTDEVAVLDARTGATLRRVPVGRAPKGASFSLDGKRLFVADSWNDAISEIDTASLEVVRKLTTGYEPNSVLATGGLLFTSNRISNDLSVIDAASGTEVKRLLAGRGAAYLAATPDGSTVYSTHIYPNRTPFGTPPLSEITVVDTARQAVTRRYLLPGAAGVFHMAVSSDGKLGIAAAMRPKNMIPLAHVEHGWVIGNALVVFGPDAGAEPVQVSIDELDRYFTPPFGVAISADKKTAYVSTTGSDSITVIDIPKLLDFIRAAAPGDRAALANDLSASANYVAARIATGRGPKGIALSPDGARLYAANRMDDSVTVIDTASRRAVQTFSLNPPKILTAQRRGERLFYSAQFAFQGHYGCANCHIEATYDGMSWDLEPDGFGKDIVDNRLLEDVSETAPFKWNGGNPNLETECGPRTEKFFYRSQSYDGFELDDLVTFIKGMPLRPNRYRLPQNELTPAQERGKIIFERTVAKNRKPIPAENQCGTCHSGPHFTNNQMFDVGSGKPTDRISRVDVPQLNNIALTAPYLHDGSARSLEEIWTVFNPNDTHGVTNDLQKDELNDLIEYLKTL